MSQYNLDRILNPRQVAVVGASEKVGSIGNALMKNLLEGGFPGPLFPVNPRYSTVHGLPAFKSILDLEPGVDLVIIATPIHTASDLVKECVQKEVGGAIVISAGGKEAGEKGRDIEELIRSTAYASGLRIVGPNCLGIIRPGLRLNASFASEMPEPGNLAFVSQSGAICTAILDLAFKEHIGFSHFVSVGSMLDVDFGDLIDYLGNDPSAKSILLYIEGLTNVRKFMSAARAVSRVKPIVVLKAGRSSAGAKAAASHTGAMTGEDAVYDAAFKRAGIVRVESIQDLFDCAELLGKQSPPRGPRMAIITNAGGPGVMAADALASKGLEPAVLDDDTLSRLNSFLPPFWSHGNPIDILGDASPERFRRTLEVCLDAEGIDAVCVMFTPQALASPDAVARSLVETMKGRPFPVFACWMGGKSIQEALNMLSEAGIPTYNTAERAIQAFWYMVEYAQNMEALLEIPPKLTRDIIVDLKRASNIVEQAELGRFLTEWEVRELLEAYGMPLLSTETACDEEEACHLAREMGYPLVMKVLSPDITHKTEAGGVKVDLRSEEDVRKAFREIMESAFKYKQDARIQGVSLQPFITNPDYEILLGAKRDPNFGPVIAFGTGGIFTEVFKDRTLGLPPMNRLLARRMIKGTKAWILLQGYRNRPPADMELLEESIIRLSQLLIDLPEIAELDMNPILIKHGKPVIVDARILVSASEHPSPLHLVISPYPAEDEARLVTEEGFRLFLRPVKPEDASLFKSFFKVLSPNTIYQRFFRYVKELTPEMLARFTQIDYDREIALVALRDEAESEEMVGVARIIGDPDGKKGEFSVVVGDPWHGQGIGSALLERCLAIAKRRGFQQVQGIVLRENKSMLALAKRLGFEIKPRPNPLELQLIIFL